MYNIEKFLEWHKDFVKDLPPKTEEPSTTNYYPDLAEFVNRINNNHGEIRELLGGIDKEIEIDTDEAGAILLESSGNANDIVESILRLLPGYLDKYNLKKTDLLKTKLKDHRNISVSKHVLGYAKRQNVSVKNEENLNWYLSRLTSLIKSSENARLVEGIKRFYVQVSTDPKAFSLIGSLGIDSNSCFKKGNMNCDKKYTYGIYPNSFVIIVRKEKFNEYKQDDKSVLFRCLGTANIQSKILNVSNLNPLYTNAYSLFLESLLKVIYKEIFKTDTKTKTVNNKIIHKGGINYINLPVISCFDDSLSTIDDQILIFNKQYSRESHTHDAYCDKD